jgi:hypothetical protein
VNLDQFEKEFLAEYGQRFAILVNGEVVPCGLDKWAQWLEEHRNEKIIDRCETQTYLVSTVFMGYNHALLQSVRPQWFETMIFDKSAAEKAEENETAALEGKLGETIYCERYTTLREAREGHQGAIAWLWGELAKKA